VTTREIETDEDFDRLARLPNIAGVGSLSRILLPTKLDSIRALREASARLKADILLLYTFDTSFRVGKQKYLPLNAISLGFLKNKEVSVTTTASAVFFDVRTEYIYGLAEASAPERKKSSIWHSAADVDELRLATEKAAFQKLLPELAKTWSGITAEYAPDET
jgi:hypothetical protein